MNPRLGRLGLVAAVAATGLATMGWSAAPVHAATWSLARTSNTPGIDAMRLAQELAGPGVTVTSATSPVTVAGGLFAGPGVEDAIGVTDGVVLSSGAIADTSARTTRARMASASGIPGGSGLDALRLVAAHDRTTRPC